MTPDRDPYGIDDASRPLRLGCSCGAHASSADHAAAELRARSETASFEAQSNAFVEASLMKALFPQDALRRKFLRAVGRHTAMAAIGSVLPIASMQALAQEKAAPIEKKDLKIGFIPITCATPLIMAKPMNVATIQNTNGQAITLAMKHKEKRDPKCWRGFKFAVPFDYSMHNFLLRYYVAEAGLNPGTDIQIRVVPPPEMVANLRAGNIDGFLGPDPFNQRAVFEEVASSTCSPNTTLQKAVTYAD